MSREVIVTSPGENEGGIQVWWGNVGTKRGRWVGEFPKAGLVGGGVTGERTENKADEPENTGDRAAFREGRKLSLKCKHTDSGVRLAGTQAQLCQ